MTEKTYNKLVRDDIPKVIENSSKQCFISVVKGEELNQLLNEKLREEVEEYIESEELEELADILEVIHGILHFKNIDIKELEEIRFKKAKERGGFREGVKLIKVIERK
ncbi:putative house-cleaning noncanonical NTP pyrophosphatase (MazG superfamily) [Natranaerovirga pectinivora]|uniref:Putative house-cleaning noncanonical NTP pyrophosphatase (MazG superfamily) n=1 Tax=Natranaerovirga pectinivora TaxID=682400 RepID=A0A4R3ML22_9FIRM|nr:nucleoside triphosphate pyrophosphohydrolase [Natranaerovirga pectinivora]TCT15372.1 putative house-cleaning noncanonical NTP pyrophosphatase (MazG superfamily) [Natranaerovirga pectinivora]